MSQASFGKSLLLAVLLVPRLLSAETRVVDNRSPAASDENPGTPEKPFRTIQAAAQAAQPGDTVRVRAGVYRERITPPRGGTAKAPIVYQAEPGECVEVKGSDVWTEPWTPEGTNTMVFSSPIPTNRFAAIPNPYLTGISIASSQARLTPARPVAPEALDKPWPDTLGQVFVRGEPLSQVGSMDVLRQMEGSWLVSADGTTLVVHLPGVEEPAVLLPTLEWSVRNRLFAPHRRGLGHIHIKGFTFLHCANQGPFPQGGAVSTRTGSNWLIEGNTIRFAKTIGLDIGSETWAGETLAETAAEDRKLMVQAGHIVRNNIISDNGLCGIAGWNSPNVRILNNLLERNNRLGFSTATASWEEWAAIKLHNSNALIAGNTIRFNEAHGIWMDNGYNLCRITGNILLGNALSGIMLELGAGSALIDNNIVAYTRSYGGFYDGNGIYAHDASGLVVAHNLLLANAGSGVLMRTITGRKFNGKPVTTSDTRLLNNVFTHNGKGAISLPFRNPRSTNNISDHNVFLGGGEFFRLNKYQDTYSWEAVEAELRKTNLTLGVQDENGDSFRRLSLEAWRAATGWDRNSVTIKEGGWNGLPYRSLMYLDVPAELQDMRCPAVDEMTIDFFGTPMATDSLVEDLAAVTAQPGPIQGLKAGKITLPLVPYRHLTEPGFRLALKERELAARVKRFEQLRATIPPAAGERVHTFSLADALGADGKDADRWQNALQADLNPTLVSPFSDLADGPVASLHMQSPKGVSSSPGRCLLFKVPAEAHYEIDLSVELGQRGSASAGFVLATLFQIDAAFENAMVVKRFELNTREGYRGDVLPTKVDFQDKLACPAGSYLVLRFQVVAPGPAPAGVGTLKVPKFNLTQLK